MVRLFFFLVWTLLLSATVVAGEPWSGNWKVTWPSGGAFLNLTQSGAEVRGSYRNGRGLVEATAQGSELEGEIIHEEVKERFRAVLSADQSSFSGYTSDGEWLSGISLGKSAPPGVRPGISLQTPRAAMQTFLEAGNRARDGDSQAIAVAVDTLEFGSSPEWTSRDAKFSAAEQLFNLIDLATFSLSVFPEETTSSHVKVSLPRLDAASTVDLEMVRSPEGTWRIVMPAAQALAAMAGAVPARPADAFRQLQSPRDTLRAFLEGMAHWDEGMQLDVISAIDLSGVPDVLKEEQGQLTAQYLVRIIDRVGRMPLQSVPNSGVSRKPFVYFENSAGQIVIEPVGTGAETRWKFSARTVQDLRRLYAAVQFLPEEHTLAASVIPAAPMFAIRDLVKAYAPALLADVAGKGRIEYWQLLGALSIFGAIAAGAAVLKRVTSRLLERPSLKPHVGDTSWLTWAIGIALAFAAGAQVVPHLGLPVATRQYTVPVLGGLFLMVITYAAWHVTGIISSIIEVYTERSKTTIDNILLTFTRGIARLALVGAAGLALGHLWSVPTTGILAGLGISGLALAFASKETLANVFGAGILLGDRPFRKGDRIIAGDVNGWVEAVGLRSTRIRTLYDSLLVVPNGKLADTTINNLGARRRRTLNTSFLVTSGSTPDKLKTFTQAILARIAADSFYEPGTEVNIIGIAANGIQIEISASLQTRSGVEYRAATHRLFLDILQMAKAEGLTLGRGMEKSPVYVLQET